MYIPKLDVSGLLGKQGELQMHVTGTAADRLGGAAPMVTQAAKTGRGEERFFIFLIADLFVPAWRSAVFLHCDFIFSGMRSIELLIFSFATFSAISLDQPKTHAERKSLRRSREYECQL